MSELGRGTLRRSGLPAAIHYDAGLIRKVCQIQTAKPPPSGGRSRPGGRSYGLVPWTSIRTRCARG